MEERKDADNEEPVSSAETEPNTTSSNETTSHEQLDEEETNEKEVVEKPSLQVTALQRVHIFVWNVYNIIRNLNILHEWLRVQKQKQMQEAIQNFSSQNQSSSSPSINSEIVPSISTLDTTTLPAIK